MMAAATNYITKTRTSRFDIFYLEYSQQHVSAGIPAIFREMLLRLYSSNNITLKMARIPVETC